MWAKLDDRMADHPKVLAVGPCGLGVYVRSILYCSRHLTDGKIPKHVLPALLLGAPDGTLENLLEAGLWDQNGDGVLVHDYLHYNPSKELTEQRRQHIHEIRSAAGKKGMDSRWHNNNNNHKTTLAITDDNPVPVPVPKIEIRDGAKLARKRAQTDPPSLEDVTKYQTEIGGTANPQAFFDYWESINWTRRGGQRIANWKAAYRQWEAHDKTFRSHKLAAPIDTHLKPMRRSEDAE